MSAMVIEPDLVPTTVGVKVTLIVQKPFTAIAVGLSGQLLVCAKSPRLLPVTAIPLIVSGLGPLLVTVIVCVALVVSLNRIAFGAHFLSDVVLAWWITLLVIAVEYRLLYINPPAALTNERLESWLTEAGEALKRGAVAVRQAIAATIGDRGKGS